MKTAKNDDKQTNKYLERQATNENDECQTNCKFFLFFSFQIIYIYILANLSFYSNSAIKMRVRNEKSARIVYIRVHKNK